MGFPGRPLASAYASEYLRAMFLVTSQSWNGGILIFVQRCLVVALLIALTYIEFSFADHVLIDSEDDSVKDLFRSLKRGIKKTAAMGFGKT